MKIVDEPRQSLIESLLRTAQRMGCPLTWQQAREITCEVVENTANDNPWP